MQSMKGLLVVAAFEGQIARAGKMALWMQSQRAARLHMRTVPKSKDPDSNSDWPRKVFSGIQPTGSLHLGNYLGAVRKWTQMQNSKDDVTFCIVDMHSLTLPPDPIVLRENIFQMAAAMLACGIDPEQSTIFVQSAVKEHAELAWILSCMSTMARLGHLPQYKEKTRLIKDVPLGLFVYPVLQAADIMLYKTTHVPVGEDQIQHIQLTQHLSKIFNTKYGPTFPICKAVIDDKDAARIRSLRDPSKKMSKSDPDPRATINLTDEPDVIVEKVKKAMTDFSSDVSYNPDTRQGVSNLIVMHSLLSGKSIKEIVEEAKSIDTGKYKMRAAEVIVEHLRPIRNKINQQMIRRNELIYVLEMGAEKARQTAQQTIAEVKQKLGLGASAIMPAILETPREELKVITKADENPIVPGSSSDKPEVPKQQLRVEKKRQACIEIKAETKLDLNMSPIILEHKPAIKKDTTSKALVPKSEPETETEKPFKEIKL